MSSIFKIKNKNDSKFHSLKLMSLSSKVLLIILISLRVVSRVSIHRLKENFDGNDRKEIKRSFLFIIRTAIRSRKITPGFHRQREAEIWWLG